MRMVIDAAGMLRNAVRALTATKRGRRENDWVASQLIDLSNDLHWLLGPEGDLSGFREKYCARFSVEPDVLLPPIIRTGVSSEP
jgi:hypothetical protein